MATIAIGDVHGQLPQLVDVLGQLAPMLRASDTVVFLGDYIDRGDETLVYGHRNNAVIDADGWPQPARHGRAIGIDTIAHGVLTAIRLPDGHIVQSARGARRA
jgi:hypothetical protein